MDLFVITLLVLPFIGMEISKDGYFSDYLRPQQTNQYKAFFAFVVILHHLAQRTQTGVLFPFFNKIGYLAVGMFFFISGYGLMFQYIKKKEQYIDHFLSHRLLKVLIPYFIAMVLYYLAYKIIGLDISIKSALQSFLTQRPYVSFSWYILATIFFYLIFYVSAKIFKEHYMFMIVMIAAGLVLYGFICHSLGHGTWWYNTCTCFLLGIVWGRYNKVITQWLQRKWMISILFSLVGFILFFQLSQKTNISGLWYHLFTHYVSSAFFCITLAFAGMKVRLNSKILQFISKISYEMYLLHGLAILFLRNDIWSIKSDLLFTAVVVLGSPLVAILFHLLNTNLPITGRKPSRTYENYSS